MTSTPPVPLTPQQAADLASKHGLRLLGARPPLGAYTRALWQRRHFIRMLATSDAVGRNQGSYLGQVWAILNPLLQFAVFWLVFGVALNMSKDTSDFLSYLAMGVFLFSFLASGLTAGSNAIKGRLGMIRALEFPRAVLPISVALTELIMVWPALVVMVFVLVVRGQPITLSWLLLIPDLALMFAFTLGCGLILARICAATPDFANLVPIVTNLLRFMSGVFYNLSMVAGDHPTIAAILESQPFGLYLKLARAAMLESVPGYTPYHASIGDWGLGVLWAALFLGVGYVFFWRAEARYGRD